MKFFYSIQVALKNTFYIDYIFKNLFFYLYKKIILANMFYLIDKYLAEKFFFCIKRTALWFNFLTVSVHKMSLTLIIKVLFFIILQLFIVFII